MMKLWTDTLAALLLAAPVQAAADPARWLIVDGHGSEDEVAARVDAALAAAFPNPPT